MRIAFAVVALLVLIVIGFGIRWVIRVPRDKDMQVLANDLISFSGHHGGRLPNSWLEFVEFENPHGWSVEELISVGHLRWGYSVFDRPPDGRYIYITGSAYGSSERAVNERLGAYVRAAEPVGSRR